MDELEEILGALAGRYLDPSGVLDSTAAIQKLLDAGERVPDGIYRVHPGRLRFSPAAAHRNPISAVWMAGYHHWYRFGPDPGVSTHLMAG